MYAQRWTIFVFTSLPFFSCSRSSLTTVLSKPLWNADKVSFSIKAVMHQLQHYETSGARPSSRTFVFSVSFSVHSFTLLINKGGIPCACFSLFFFGQYQNLFFSFPFSLFLCCNITAKHFLNKHSSCQFMKNWCEFYNWFYSLGVRDEPHTSQ